MTSAADQPAPLTTADIDLDGMPGFMLDTEQLRQSELWALSTGEEFKAAVGLWCRAWVQKPAGSLPNDDRLLAAWSGAGRRWPKVRDMALRGFVLCSDGRLYHRVLCQDALERRQVFRARAEQGGYAKARRASGLLQADIKHASSSGEQCLEHASGLLEPAQGQRQRQGDIQGPPNAPIQAGVSEAPIDLPIRLRETWREILTADGPSVANAALQAGRRIFRSPSPAQLLETWKCAASAGRLHDPSDRWPDFRQTMRADRQRERAPGSVQADAETLDLARQWDEQDRQATKATP
jgi:hypothetical protein